MTVRGASSADADSIRLFVAVDLLEQVKAGICELQGGLAGVRWTPLGQLHLTVRFIGPVDRDRYARIREVLGTVQSRPFPLQVRGAGRFPPGGLPRILWVGLAETGQLALLHGEVERALAGAGVEPDERRFSPHITVARLKEPRRDEVAAWLERHARFAAEPFPVAEFHLYSSVLSSGGAVHRREASWTLGGR